ncbi:MAG: hypothetical protein KA419_09800 [Acidobacteria bacterium]|nr:hypothetical protein [Acidobacteriota bacterium]
MAFQRAHNAVFIVLVFGCTAFWTYRAGAVRREAAEAADRYRDAGRSVVTLSRCELYLKAASVRIFAKRTGRMPVSLRECAGDGASFDDWMAWLSKERRAACRDPLLQEEMFFWSASPPRQGGGIHPGPFYRDRLGVPVGPWALVPWSDSAPLPPLPPGLDPSGLPVLYRVGGSPPRDPAAIRSDDPLPPEIAAFFQARGGEAPVPPQPFSLVSLRIRDRLDQQARLDDRVTRAWLELAGGLILGTALVLAILYRWGSPRKRRMAAGLAILGALSVFAWLWGSTRLFTKVHSSFYTGISRGDLIAVLDEAVRRGEVPPETAAASRQYLLSLPADDASRGLPLRVRD